MFAKRLFDIVTSAIALLILSPVLFACAVWISIDSPGGFFYRQERVGRNGKLFYMLKFRSMFTGSDSKGLLTVGNNDVPYPYAIDSKMNYYLMIENAKLKIPSNHEDPYKYYYQAQLLTPDLAFKTIPIFYSGISEFNIDSDPYTLRYDIDPIKEFKRLQRDIGKNIQIKLVDGTIIKLTAQKYKKIMDDFNERLQVKKIA